MSRTRLTVDGLLLERARQLRLGVSDRAIVDEALLALLRRHHSALVDATYTAYDTHPLDKQDAWGDLASFRQAAAES